MLLLHRLRWLASACYWSARHRSVERGRWVAEFEHGRWPTRSQPATPPAQPIARARSKA